MENIWMCGQRSALQRRSPGQAVQTEESLDSDAWLSPREGAGVSADINPPPLTSTPQFQPQCLPKVRSEGRPSWGGGRCELQWEGRVEVTPYCNLWTGMSMGWLWHSSRMQLQEKFLLGLCDVAKPAHGETDEAWLDHNQNRFYCQEGLQLQGIWLGILMHNYKHGKRK